MTDKTILPPGNRPFNQQERRARRQKSGETLDPAPAKDRRRPTSAEQYLSTPSPEEKALRLTGMVHEPGYIGPAQPEPPHRDEIQREIMDKTFPTTDQIHTAHLVQALRLSRGNRSQAASLLGITNCTVYNRIKRLEEKHTDDWSLGYIRNLRVWSETSPP